MQYEEVQHQIVGQWYGATLTVWYQNSTTFNSATVNGAINSANSKNATSNTLK